MKHWPGILLLGSVLLLWFAISAAAQDETPPAPTPTAGIPLETMTPGGPTPTPVPLDPLLNIAIEPPIDITLPDDWLVGYDTLAFRDIDGSVQTALVAVYTGPVTGGTGWLILAWGHDSVINPFAMETPERAAFLDGLRLLRLIIFDPSCEVNVQPQTEYTIGEEIAQGATFSATNCPGDQPDTSGWFAALMQEEVNFAFYVYIDPEQAAESPARAEMQAILDSVNIRIDEVIVSQEEFEATRSAILAQTPSAEITPEATPEVTEAP